MIILHQEEIKKHLWRAGYVLLSDGRLSYCPNAWTADPKRKHTNVFPPSAARGSYVRSGGRV